MKFIKHISFGEKFPGGYGLAWRNYDSLGATAMPIPICFIVRLSLWVYYGLAARWFSRNWLDRKIRERMNDTSSS